MSHKCQDKTTEANNCQNKWNRKQIKEMKEKERID